MERRRLLILVTVAVVLLTLPWGMNPAKAADGGAAGRAMLGPGDIVSNPNTYYANSPQPDPNNGQGAPGVGYTPFDSGTPIRKFVTKLPGLGPNNANEINQFIPVAHPIANPLYPNDDFYTIGVFEYSQRLHPDLAKATTLRGYKDLNSNADPNPNGSYYLGPAIIATSGKPVRILFKNQLPTLVPGNLFLPMDYTVMGAGMGPDMIHFYLQNRAVLHLHGGFTPWISDGTPHQWITPTGVAGPYFPQQTNPFYNFKGVSFQNVPDMVGAGKTIPAPTPTDALATYYYTNQQSARLMFYHDHAYGITRLNVYAGMAAPYLITDTAEQALITGNLLPNQSDTTIDPNATGLYQLGIPLVIQDKTFVPKDYAIQDSSWNPWRNVNCPGRGQPGDLWFPHKYEPNQDPKAVIGGEATGASLFGRWDYGPWFWPPTPTTTLPNPSGGVGTAHLLPGEATNFSNPWVYSQSLVPEAFMDTMVVNGNLYPYLNVNPTAYRFRMLNACNDRNLNLSMFVADTGGAVTSVDPVTHAVLIPNGATAAATVLNGAVDTLTLTPNTATYTSAPGVYITGGGGTGATATVAFAPQTLASTAITVTNGGTGYTSAPKVTIRGGGLIAGGTPATATATLNGNSVGSITIKAGTGIGYTDAPRVSITGGGGFGATAMAALTPAPLATITLTDGGADYTSNPTVQIGGATEVKMVDAVATAGYPSTWPTDGRAGGVPDPATRGPNLIQIGNECGFLPAPALIPSQPVNYDYNRRNIVVLNVLDKALFAGPAERADFIVDFSAFAGKTVILYNDAPAPVPAFDPRYDYYTGSPDQRVNGGAATTLPGFGPNTRTVMQFRVGTTGGTTAFNLAALQAPATGLPHAFSVSQPKPIVPEPGYNAAYGTTFTGTYSSIQATSLTFNDFGNYFPLVAPVNGLKTIPMLPKAIQELFDNYGRMNAILGVEVPFTNILNQTTLPFQYIDPPTEGGNPLSFPGAVPIKNGDTQIWKITHNGVDTHTIHFHLVNVQVINRVGWDGAIRPPDPNEIGWKESVRMHPLEDCIVAAQFKLPAVPFPVPISVRLLDVTSPIYTTGQFSAFDATGNPPPTTVRNVLTNFGWEYVWHCHLLGHEENDMMRPIVVNP